MMKKVFLLIALLVLAFAVVGVGQANHNTNVFYTTLTGAEEFPGPGDPDGTGFARIRLAAHSSRICYFIRVRRIEPAQAAHIHVGAAGTAGGVVLHLKAPNARGWSSGCTPASLELIEAIRANPENYYVNVHNVPFPGGAVRGQLGD
jgi:hypothetical protein